MFSQVLMGKYVTLSYVHALKGNGLSYQHHMRALVSLLSASSKEMIIAAMFAICRFIPMIIVGELVTEFLE